MKEYSKPKMLIEDNYNNSSFSKFSIFPSTGAITGAAHMLARSAAKASLDNLKLPILQNNSLNS